MYENYTYIHNNDYDDDDDLSFAAMALLALYNKSYDIEFFGTSKPAVAEWSIPARLLDIIRYYNIILYIL